MQIFLSDFWLDLFSKTITFLKMNGIKQFSNKKIFAIYFLFKAESNYLISKESINFQIHDRVSNQISFFPTLAFILYLLYTIFQFIIMLSNRTANEHQYSSSNGPPALDKNRSIQDIIRQLGISRMLPEQIQQLDYIVNTILGLSSLEKAEIHRKSSKLGAFDIINRVENIKQSEYCSCCGYIIQQEDIPLCLSFNQFPSVGISTYLYFQTIKNLIFLLLLTSVIFSVYSLVTNLYSMGLIFTDSSSTSIPSLADIGVGNYLLLLISWISLSSKVYLSNTVNGEQHQIFYMAEMWIGTGLVIIWSLAMYIIKYYDRKYEVLVNQNTISAADFSIIIENYPKNMPKQQLQKQLRQYESQLQQSKTLSHKRTTVGVNSYQNTEMNVMEYENENKNQSTDSILIVEKICIGSGMSENQQSQQSQIQKINQKLKQMQQNFTGWIQIIQQKGQLPLKLQERKAVYQKYHELKNQRTMRATNLLTNVVTSLPILNLKERNSQEDQRAIAFVTFKYSNSKDLIYQHNSMSITQMIRYFIKCCPRKEKFVLANKKDSPGSSPSYNIKISKAPEPEDVKWQNLSFPFCQKVVRKLITYLVTLLLLGISFSLVYLLSIEQLKNSQNFYLSLLISITISVINFSIGLLIRFLTAFQKDYTFTDQQTSLAIKSIWAQLINSIVIPVVANYLIENKNIYGTNGLSTDIIILALINSFLPPITKLIDPAYRIKVIQSYFIRKSLTKRLLKRQIQFNISQEPIEFQTGFQYIYFVNLYLFTVYFVTLQPCISIFSVIGMIFMYWVQKYSLLKRVKRPVPGTDLINTAMSQLVSLGPVFFSLGALTWSHFLDGYKVQQGQILYYIPNIITASFATFFFIFPFSIIFEKCFPKLTPQNLEYQKCRAFLNSQYDRTNPKTMKKAIRQHEQYLESIVVEDAGSQQEIKINNGEMMTIKKSIGMKKVDKEFINKKKQILHNQTNLLAKQSNQMASIMSSLLVGADSNSQGNEKAEKEMEKKKTRKQPSQEKQTMGLDRIFDNLAQDRNQVYEKNRESQANQNLYKRHIKESEKFGNQRLRKIDKNFRADFGLQQTETSFETEKSQSKKGGLISSFGQKNNLLKRKEEQLKGKNEKQSQRAKQNPYERYL